MHPNRHQQQSRHGYNGPASAHFSNTNRGTPGRGGYGNNNNPHQQNYRGGLPHCPVDNYHYQPPPPTPLQPLQQNPGPVQVTLTIDPGQFIPKHLHHHHHQTEGHQSYDAYDTGYNPNTNCPQSQSFRNDQPPPYSPSPSDGSAPYLSRHSNSSHHSGVHYPSGRPPSPPPAYNERTGILETPQSQNLSAPQYPHHHSSLGRAQQEEMHNDVPSLNYNGQNVRRMRGGGGRGRDCYHGNLNSTQSAAGSMSDLSDRMPLGCEASQYNRPKFQNNDKFKGNRGMKEKNNDDGNVSVQSMPARGRNPSSRGSSRGGRGRNNRGGRGGRGGGFRRMSTRSANNDLELELEKDEDGYEDSDVEDTESLASSASTMIFKNRKWDEHHKNKQQHKKDPRFLSNSTKDEGDETLLTRAQMEENVKDQKNVADVQTKKRGNENNKNNYKKEPGDFKTNAKLKVGGNSGSFLPKTPPKCNNEFEKGKKKDIGSNYDSHTHKAPLEMGKKQRGKKKVTQTVNDVNFEQTAKKLNVFVKIKRSFENEDDLKRVIEESFVFPDNGKFQVKFLIEPKLEEKYSSIKFLFLTNNVWMANKCLKNMIGKLRGKLRTYVHFIVNLDKSQDSNAGKGARKSEELDDIKKDGQEIKSGDGGNETVPGEDEPCEATVPDRCPVNFRLFMDKSFSQVDGCIDFITIILNDFSSIEDFQIKRDSIILNKTSSECSIDLRSKADAKRLKKTLSKIRKETKLEMKYEVTKVEQEAKIDGDELKAWNSRIQKIMKKMEDKRKDAVDHHEQKLSSLRTRKKYLEQSGEDDDVAEMGAVEDKLTEALKQKVEFGHKYKAIIKKIQEIEPTKRKGQELNKAQENFGIECQRLLNALPIYARRKDIISHVKANQVSIILGETGSGKSTQIAQYLHEAGIVSKGVIVCTQPRKVAALQLADRVAQELGEATGGVVGFKTGNKRKGNDDTKIMFMTDHSLLNECLQDRDFNRYSCIIVDEAHERSIYTDILLGMIKTCLERRPDLRVVITSATIDPRVFINYFECPEEIRVSGRTYPVEVLYMDSSDDFENYETKAVSKAAEIHKNEAAGDILVFLTSPVEIQRCCEEFCKLFKNRNDFKCLPLHGQLLPEEQKKVFARLDEGVRKVVFATNCAETSITIDGIKYVIDTGVSKEMRYDAKKNLNLLGIHMISQSSADQRKGRAGRTASGKCYRLFSEEGYQAMRTINEPEILRVHLGQAILKLAELGVNIKDYDFVEAPSENALLAAIETLEFLSAIKDEKITELGRWISKLPLDPKLGCIVYKANCDGLLYDAVVLASVVSNGSGIFYRGMTETEAQISARCKAQFGLESGDIFTWLTIYKIWEGKLTSKERRLWCQSNCINYKSMNYARTCIEETITALKHELKVDVEKQFSDEPSSMTILSKHMLRAYGLSLCHFMGHNRAGYFSIFSERQVHFHPSCTLAAQNLHPQWVVFVELVKTSREFIKGILVVDEEWIQEAVDDGYFDVNIAKAKTEMLTVVHKEGLGACVCRAVVGPRFSNLKPLEEMCEASGMKHPIVEADRDLGTICIYSSSPAIHPDVVERLQEVKSEAVSKLEKEESECKIFNKGATDSPNIRAILGPGACVRQVLMPHQTTEVLLRRVGDATEEDIMMKFSEFGNILEVIPFKNNEPWGFLRYRSVEEALIAVERTKKDETIAGSLRLDRVSENTKNMFQAKVSWLRRPVKGEGTAFIKVDPMDKADLYGKDIIVNGVFKRINISRKGKQNNVPQDVDSEPDLDLIVFKIGETTEEEVRDGILAMIRRPIDIKRITIPRIHVPAPSHKELEDIKTALKTLIDPRDKEKFTVWISKPQNSSVHFTAFLYFTDPVRGFHICQRKNQRISMGNHTVKISPSLKTTILIPKKIKDACREQMDELLDNMERDLGVDLEWKKLKEDHAITIMSENPESIVKARECITNELKGDIIDCNQTKSCLCLFSECGQEFLKKVQKQTGCVIISDKRTKKIHMYGKLSKQSRAWIEINKYFGDNELKKEKLFKLKSLGKPQGLMKALMNKFGPLVDGLNKEYKLSSATLDCRTHTLKCLGSEASIMELEKFMSTFEVELFQSNQAGRHSGQRSLPECVVCLDDVESKESLYRLEACGHPYCTPCFEHQILSCVQSNQFPMVCAEDGCGRPLVWKDLRFIFSRNCIQEERLIHSSLNFLVSTQSDKYKFCPTPNCPVVYETTEDEAGCEFNCAACFASTCTSCHLAFHAGASCQMAKSESNAQNYLEEWCAVDPIKRKLCPGCKSPIEKIEGCNKMRCESCTIVFCWICQEIFDSSQKCYAHLTKTHGGMY